MFLCKGGQAVKKGTYWAAGTTGRIVLEDDGYLPGTGREVYFKLPESYILILPILLALGIPMVIPVRTEYMIIALVVASVLALYAAESVCSVLIKKILGKTATFGYSPTTAYLSGKKIKRIKKQSVPADANGKGQ
jgi:hypothetical protein